MNARLILTAAMLSLTLASCARQEDAPDDSFVAGQSEALSPPTFSDTDTAVTDEAVAADNTPAEAPAVDATAVAPSADDPAADTAQ